MSAFTLFLTTLTILFIVWLIWSALRFVQYMSSGQYQVDQRLRDICK